MKETVYGNVLDLCDHYVSEFNNANAEWKLKIAFRKALEEKRDAADELLGKLLMTLTAVHDVPREDHAEVLDRVRRCRCGHASQQAIRVLESMYG